MNLLIPNSIPEKNIQSELEFQATVFVKENVDLIRQGNVDNTRSSDKLKYSFFVFVNHKSGSNKAKNLIKLGLEKMVFSSFAPDYTDIELSIYDITDAQNCGLGLSILKREQEGGKRDVRVIIGGGDGTIMWAVEEMIRAKIDFSRCPIGVIAFGTGNDFSIALGWGGIEPSVLIGDYLEGLKKQARKWVKAPIEEFDVWDITIETYAYGGIKRINKSKGFFNYEKRYLTTTDPETNLETKACTFTRRMSNYFSFGVDSRIGYGFDKRRTHSRFRNKFMYAWEGAKKIFMRTPKLNDVLEAMHHDEFDEKSEDEKDEDKEIVLVENIPANDTGAKTQKSDELKPEKFRMFPSVAPLLEDTSPDTKISVIKGNHAVFLCLNIPSYMGGGCNPWAKSKGRVGVTDNFKVPYPDFEEQKFGDGKLELLGLSGPISLAMERYIHGRGWRLGQVQGPFTLNFKCNKNEVKPLHSYMQIDGEYYDVVAPKCVRVSLCKALPGGKIKVMVNPNGMKSS